jgi:hypothetical protein
MNGANGFRPWCTTIMGGLVCGRVRGPEARPTRPVDGARASCWAAGRELGVEQVHPHDAEAAEEASRVSPDHGYASRTG